MRSDTREQAHPKLWALVAAVEVVLAAAAVVADLLVPTFVILALAGISLAYHRQGPSSLGFHRHDRPWRMAGIVLVLAMAWTVLQLALFMPVLEHAFGERQDVSAFAELEGNAGQYVLLMALSWTVAAVGEEAAYRGFIQTRATEAFGGGRIGVVLAVGVAAVLFGLAHSEQGAVGIGLTFLDAVFFSVLRLRFATVWAAVLAHGFNNTIGLTAYFLIGPVFALW